jgi:DNA-binding response OmpR family regulator
MPATDAPQPDERCRLVYVEDDQRLAQLTSQYLVSHLVEVFLVQRGDRALQEVLRVRPDIVLLDLMLPGRDGTQVCRDLRDASMCRSSCLQRARKKPTAS